MAVPETGSCGLVRRLSFALKLRCLALNLRDTSKLHYICIDIAWEIRLIPGGIGDMEINPMAPNEVMPNE
jgi:hypothetical protein